jgi:hypothetical protein
MLRLGLTLTDGQKGRRSFAVTLRHAPAGVKWIALRTETIASGNLRKQWVRVR